WDGSPIIYRQTAEWERIRGIMGGYFDPSVSARHYISLAKKNFDICRTEGNIKLKKYLYCLRSLLACSFIVNRCAPPPVLFSELVRTELDPPLMQDIEDILRIKESSPETQYIPAASALDNYTAARLKYLENALPAPSAKGRDIAPLDNIFLEIIKQHG
ncbi:MAG: DNA polymerase beta superfamily protein, partial [Oscillospiraceae bacterium]